MTRSMNQAKIGRLIAKMRKQKDLTQRELGEMVGVGYRAVSKWETGQTMPDISIINELSTILGISSDELLKGELNSKEDKPEISTTEIDHNSSKKSNKRKLLLLIIPLLIIVAVISTLIIKNNNKFEEYIIKSKHPQDYQVAGTINVENNNIIIKIDKIEFQDYKFSHVFINDYEYSVEINRNFVFGFGINDDVNSEYVNMTNNETIESFFNKFKIYYRDKLKMPKRELKNGILLIKLSLTNDNNEKIFINIENELVDNVR